MTNYQYKDSSDETNSQVSTLLIPWLLQSDWPSDHSMINAPLNGQYKHTSGLTCKLVYTD